VSKSASVAAASASVTVPFGANSVQFKLDTGPAVTSTPRTAVITASSLYDASSASATITVTPVPDPLPPPPPPPVASPITITLAELDGGRLRIDGRGATPNAAMTVNGRALGAADGTGNFRLRATGFSAPSCTATVSDGTHSKTTRLDGC